MSALPPKADIGWAHWDVRYGPITDSCAAAIESHSITLSTRESNLLAWNIDRAT